MKKQGYLKFEGKKIFYTLDGPSSKGKLPAILFIHGSSPSRRSIDIQVNDFKKDFICLTFFHLGCAKSEGNFSNYSLGDRYKQTKFILSFLKNLPNIDQQNITVIGISMGGHVASRLAGTEDFKNLILRVPASYSKSYEYKRIMDKWLPWQEEQKRWPWRPSCAFEGLLKFKGNVLVVESGEDEIVPQYMVREFFAQAKNAHKKDYKVMKTAHHSLHDNPELNEEFITYIRNFIDANN